MSVSMAVVTDQDGDVLLLLRGTTAPQYPDCWGLPGGKVEVGEEPDVAMRRELLEETGIDATDMEHVGIQYHPGARCSVYHVRCAGRPTVKLNYEHVLFEWVSVPELRARVEAEPATFAGVLTRNILGRLEALPAAPEAPHG